MPPPPLDLVALQKQLAPFHAVLFPAAIAKAEPPIVPGGIVSRPSPVRADYDAVPWLIVKLSSAIPRERALAADELGKRGESAAPAVPALRRLLADQDGRVRASAALALGGIGNVPEEGVEDIRRAVLDPNEEVRHSAREALRRLRRS